MDAFLTGALSVISSVGLIGFIIRLQNAKIDELKENAVEKEKHKLMCDAQQLRLEAHVSKEIAAVNATLSKLRDEAQCEFRKVMKVIEDTQNKNT